MLPHKPEIAVVSKFTSPPRRGEDAVGARMFDAMGFDVRLSPYRWEGEADLEHVRDSLYVGGYGQRSTREAFDWMTGSFGMDIVEVRLPDPRLYHLDCSFFL